MLILLDQDGPLADFEGHFYSLWTKEHPTLPRVKTSDRKVFDINEDYPEFCQELIWDLIKGPGFFLNIPPVEKAFEVVRRLQKKHDIRICTSPLTTGDYCASEKLSWVYKWYGKDMVRKTIITKDKSLVRGEILLDDRPNFKYLSLTPTWTHVVFNAPYNVKTDKDRVNWDSFEEYIERFQEHHHNFATE
jgi:5'-nucleotidase